MVEFAESACGEGYKNSIFSFKFRLIKLSNTKLYCQKEFSVLK